MNEPETNSAPLSVEDQSAVLYKAENEARDTLDQAIHAVAESTLEEERNAKATEAAIQAQEVEMAAISASNEFADQNIDALHEAALKEAAQRVADVYAEAEATAQK